MGTVQVKLKLKKLFKKSFYFFSKGFQGEVAELKIYNRELTDADFDKYYDTP